MSKYYAVKGNGEKHLFTDWDSCKEFLDGKKGYKYKSFSSKKEAEFYFSDKDYAESLVAEDLKNGFAVAFLHGYDSLGKIELLNKPFRKAIPCILTITQIKQLYH